MKLNDKTGNKETAKSIWLKKANHLFANKERLIFYSGLILTAIFSLLLFEPKVSIGGDDSIYINRAYNFLHEGDFPTFQAPLYPIVLSLILAISGLNLIAFKIFSLICMLGFYWFTFSLFKNYLEPFLLFIFSVLLATSAALLSYASLTYSEAFYLFIQSIFLFYFDKKMIRNFVPNFPAVLIISVLLLLLFLTRNVGLVAFLSASTFLVFKKEWKTAIQMLVFFLLLYGLYHILKISIWDIPDIQTAGQGSTLFLKNSFRPELGKETTLGFLLRLAGNSVYYLGYHLFNIFGLSSGEEFLVNATVALVVYFIFFRGFLSSFNEKSFWFFIGIYVLLTIGVTFFLLQTYWNQERLIITIAPFILIFLLHSLYNLFNNKLIKFSASFLLFIGLLITFNLYKTLSKIPEQTKTITRYFQGDRFYGFPEDWQNYLAMAQWSSENLPSDAFVACRKPGMAFIYGKGRNFHGIWRVTSDDPEVLYKKLKDAGVTHVIVASLRTNPDDPDSPLIKTVRNYMEAIYTAYPDQIKLVQKLGDNWPSYLYELN